jgi:hypothetical protein
MATKTRKTQSSVRHGIVKITKLSYRTGCSFGLMVIFDDGEVEMLGTYQERAVAHRARLAWIEAYLAA